jgi:hypothetical protein
MKILHYALIALNQHDLDNPEIRETDFDINLSDTLTFGNESMYNVSNMDYNTTISVDLNNNSMSTVTFTGESIDDATPEEWDSASKKVMGNK